MPFLSFYAACMSLPVIIIISKKVYKQWIQQLCALLQLVSVLLIDPYSSYSLVGTNSPV